MREAIRLSRRSLSKSEGGPFGAVVVRGGRVLSRGWNQVLAWNDPTAHAEVIAIREACGRLKRFHLEDCELYTSCEPCPMCLSAIYWARLKTVYFANTRQDAARIGFDDAAIYAEVAEPVKKRRLQMRSLLRQEALGVFRAWAAQPDRIRY